MPETIPYEKLIDQASDLVTRLERISADSIWARRSSGVRGTLLKYIEAYTHPASRQPDNSADRYRLEEYLRFGYWMLEKSARELTG